MLTETIDGVLTVTRMDPDDVAFFILYREQLNGPDPLTRDSLPYTERFDWMLAEFNRRVGATIDHSAFWNLTRSVLKAGEDNIEAYLTSRGVTFPPKP